MKKQIIIYIVSFILIMAGSIWTAFEVFDYKLTNKFTKNELTTKTVSYETSINKARVFVKTDCYRKIKLIKSDLIPVGTVKINVTYFNQLFSVNYSSNISNREQTLLLSFNRIRNEENFNNIRMIINITIDGLKNKTIYNYAKALRPSIEVLANSSDINTVKIR